MMSPSAQRTSSAGLSQPDTGGSGGRATRRWLLYGGLAVALAAIIVAVGGLISALTVRRHLIDGEADLRHARSLLVEGEAERAGPAFEEAVERFSAASDAANGAWLDVLGWIPVVGRTPDAMKAIAEAGRDVGEAGITLADGVSAIPGGLDTLTPSGGRVPLERLTLLGTATASASDQVADALGTLRAAPSDFLLGPVEHARVEAEAETRSLHGTLSSAAAILDGMPGFLGGDGPKRYFFGAQNPAELRGTGGVMGAYSILTIDDGRFGFSGFEPVQSLPVPVLDEVPGPSEEFARNYDQFRGGRRFWLAINLTPDFPSAARAILDAYEATEGERLDGVIMADPFAMQALLRVTGPAYVPRLDRTVEASEAVDFLANGAYEVYRDPETRKRVLGAVAESVFAGFLSRGGNGLADMRELLDAAAGGHILAYSRDPAMERGLAGTGAGGALPEASGDVLSVIENSAGGTKVDFFQDRRIRYDVDLWENGDVDASTTVDLTNGAPTSGQPRYVIGPRPGHAELGEDVQLVTMYCNACTLEEAHRDDEAIAMRTGAERGLTYFRDYFGVSSGESRQLRLRWHRRHGWEGDGTGGTYRLAFLSQPTVRPTSVEIRIAPPPGMHVVSMSEGMRLDGEAAVWEGVPERRLDLEVTFQPPLLTRMWRALTT